MGETMNKAFLSILSLFIVITGCTTASQNAGNTVLDLNINQIKLNVSDEKQIEYLGLKNSAKNFTFQDLQTDIIIIDLFSMYCSYCQKKAPIFNDFFHKVNNSPFSNKIKFIGLGFGNSKFEVNVFKKKYNVPFPLFADPNYKISDKLNIDIVPHFAVLQRNADGYFIMVHKNQGDIDRLEQFIFENFN